MFKVIVERPRWGGGVQEPKGFWRRLQSTEMDEWPSREGMRRRWSRQTFRKDLSENLAPLRRFIGSQVGRLWDDVYSEICANISMDSAVQRHVLDHVWDFVTRDVECVNGQIRYARAQSWICRDGRGLHHDYFVDPETGVLQLSPHMRPTWRRPIRPKFDDWITLSDTRQLRCRDGVWYEVEVSILPCICSFRDHWLRRMVDTRDATLLRKTYGRLIYARAKRQLGSREIRRYRKKYPGVMERIETTSARASP